jgi:hypothetical protein
MSSEKQATCLECERGPDAFAELDRREFMRTVAVTAGVAGLGSQVRADNPAADAARHAKLAGHARPAEELVQELFGTLTAEQKQKLILPYEHGTVNGKGMATRLGMYNSPVLGKRIGEHYTKPQQELIERILRAISSDEEGYRRISRNGTFDGSKSLDGCGALLFGEPAEGKEWSWVFTGHHLTVRCDGRPKDGVGFGGPMYYGHSPNGYSDRNVFYYQTKSVLGVYDMLDEKQRKAAVIVGTPGEQIASVRFRTGGQPRPGLAYAELSKDQQGDVEKVMRSLLSPYRKEDADEVMDIIKATGGMEKIHLAFYQQPDADPKERWHFWRLEGPGFVWNFRVLPHVHTYVNIASKVG